MVEQGTFEGRREHKFDLYATGLVPFIAEARIFLRSRADGSPVLGAWVIENSTALSGEGLRCRKDV
jgi:hypothetical protein